MINLAKRGRKAKRRRGPATIPLAVVMGTVGGLIGHKSGWNSVLSAVQQGQIRDAGKVALAYYTGYDCDRNTFDWSCMQVGLMPLLGGMLLHFAASKLGVNRALGRAKVPFLRI